jgi:hypothetical protein
MAMGMDLLIKSLGIDPAVIAESAQNFQAMIAQVASDLAEIKAQNAEILARLPPVDSKPRLQIVHDEEETHG